MVARADAGDIVDQEQVPVDPEDTALELYKKLLPAAERVLARRLDELLRGAAPRRPQDAEQATTFGGRRPEDGRIDWAWPAQRIHDLVRAVSKPWPGAFCDTDRGRVTVWRTRVEAPAAGSAPRAVGEVWRDPAGRTLVQTGEGLLELLELEFPEGFALDAGATLQEASA
jgi:methionyl-tRNA formyltransferase